MRFALTDEQEMLRDSVRGALARDLPLSVVRASPDAPAAARALATAQGWPGIGVSEDAGGQGGDVVELAILAEELGRGAIPTSLLIASALAARALAGGGDHGAALVAELAAGSLAVIPLIDAGDARRGSVRQDGARATGAVGHVLAAPQADILLVSGDDGLRVIKVSEPGCTVIARDLVDAGRTIGDVVLEDVEASWLGTSWDVTALTDLGAVLVSAEAVGAAARALELTVDYVTQREQFGVRVGSFQAVKHAAADMLVEVETARSAVYYAAWALGAGDLAAVRAVCIAKSFAVPAASRVTDTALALHGAVGFTWEHDLHLFLKRAHSARALFGSASAHRTRLAAQLDLTGAQPGLASVA